MLPVTIGVVPAFAVVGASTPRHSRIHLKPPKRDRVRVISNQVQ